MVAMRQRPFHRSALLLILLALSSKAHAATYEVASLADLQARINAATAGDIIVLRNGAYTTAAPITIDRKGAAGKPIRIAAGTPGKVEIAGTDGFDVVAGAAYIEIDGFHFTHASGKTQIRPRATHVRFTRNIFEEEAHDQGAEAPDGRGLARVRSRPASWCAAVGTVRVRADPTSSRRSVSRPRPSTRQSRERGTARRRRSSCAGCSQNGACARSAGAA